MKENSLVVATLYYDSLILRSIPSFHFNARIGKLGMSLGTNMIVYAHNTLSLGFLLPSDVTVVLCIFIAPLNTVRVE